jgi:nucleoside-diphosphate-sugar epimerase
MARRGRYYPPRGDSCPRTSCKCTVPVCNSYRSRSDLLVSHTNITQTYNILEAARVAGVKNIALASSETVFGIPLHPHPPESFPLTEEPERPESSYSLAKLLGEKMSEQFTRWDPELKIVNIRLSNVIAPEDYINFPKWQDDPWQRAWK